MDLSLLSILKMKLLQEKQIANIWTFYMDNFTDHAEFVTKSQTVDSHKQLEEVLTSIIAQLFPDKKAIVLQFGLMTFPKHKFFHGSVYTTFGPVNYFFFDDIKTGSTLYCTGKSNGENKFSRFVCEKLPNGGLKASLN